MNPIWHLHIFQMGWFNHQLVMVGCICRCIISNIFQQQPIDEETKGNPTIDVQWSFETPTGIRKHHPMHMTCWCHQKSIGRIRLNHPFWLTSTWKKTIGSIPYEPPCWLTCTIFLAKMMDSASSLTSQLPISVCAIVGLEVAATSFIEILRSQVPHVAHVAWMNQLSTHIGSWASREHADDADVMRLYCERHAFFPDQHIVKEGEALWLTVRNHQDLFAVTSQWKMTPWTSGQILVDMNLKFLQLWKLCITKPTFQLVLSKEWSNESKFTVKSRVLSPITELHSLLRQQPTSSRSLPNKSHVNYTIFANLKVGDRCWIFNLGPAVLQKRGYAASWKHRSSYLVKL